MPVIRSIRRLFRLRSHGHEEDRAEEDNIGDETHPTITTDGTSTTAVTAQIGPETSSHKDNGDTDDDEESCSSSSSSGPTNEYVLNVAFLSFLVFTTIQLFFATIAHSTSMMADCMAMYVDVLTYFFNFVAERLKHPKGGRFTAHELRLRRLYLELIPPSISVITLISVTVLALQEALETLFSDPKEDDVDPDLNIMLAFSGANLLLDMLNVFCFARVDEAQGWMPQVGHAHHYSHHGHCEIRSSRVLAESELPSEVTPLIKPPIADPADHDHDVDEDEESEMSALPGGINLNMCSAFTHIAADTLRSVAVLLAAGFATLFPSVLTASQADAWGAILVSIIILASLAPLLHGLYLTAVKIRHVYLHHPDDEAGILSITV